MCNKWHGWLLYFASGLMHNSEALGLAHRHPDPPSALAGSEACGADGDGSSHVQSCRSGTLGKRSEGGWLNSYLTKPRGVFITCS